MTCAATSGAFFTTVTPNSTTGSGDITGAELSGLNLTYPSSITYTSHYYGCGAGTAIANDVVYVANQTSSTVTLYAANPSGTLNEAPLATLIGTGLSGPYSARVDSGGKIYVTNYNSNTITVYPPNPKPERLRYPSRIHRAP